MFLEEVVANDGDWMGSTGNFLVDFDFRLCVPYAYVIITWTASTGLRLKNTSLDESLNNIYRVLWMLSNSASSIQEYRTKVDSLHERKRYHNRTIRIHPVHHNPLEFCRSRRDLKSEDATKRSTRHMYWDEDSHRH